MMTADKPTRANLFSKCKEFPGGRQIEAVPKGKVKDDGHPWRIAGPVDVHPITPHRKMRA